MTQKQHSLVSVKLLSRALARVPGALIILAMPIGLETDSSSTPGVVVGVHGGTGHVASVLRSCSGEILNVEKHSFTDVSGSAFAIIPYSDKSSLVVGARAGRWRLDAESGSWPGKVTGFNVFNPSVSLESERFGAGIGFFTHRIPSSTRNGSASSMQASGHVRFGSLRNGYVLMSVGENEPILSSGGLVEIAAGYPIGSRSMMQTGLAGGFYDGLGVVQRVYLETSTHWSLDLSLRLGTHGQHSVSGGVVFHLGGSKRD